MFFGISQVPEVDKVRFLKKDCTKVPLEPYLNIGLTPLANNFCKLFVG